MPEDDPVNTLVKTLGLTKTVPLVMSKIDLSGCFYQYAASSPERSRVALFNADKNRYQIFKSNCLTFGNRHSILAAQAVTDMLVLLGLSAGIVVSGYVDDFVLIAPADIAETQFRWFKKTLRFLGFDLSDKPGGCVLGQIGQPIDILGLDYTVYEDRLTVGLGEAKIVELEKAIFRF